MFFVILYGIRYQYGVSKKVCLQTIIKPKHFVQDTISRTVPSKVIFIGSLSSELLKITHLGFFCRFNDSLFVLIQESKFSSSETRILTKM